MSYSNKEKQREYQINWKTKRRNEFFNSKCCKVCGSVTNLVLHHRNPEEKISHKIWSWSENKRKQEIDKCDVLCSDCHKKHHSEIAKNSVIHGSVNMYKHYKCRCEKCREANKLKRREERANKE